MPVLENDRVHFIATSLLFLLDKFYTYWTGAHTMTLQQMILWNFLRHSVFISFSKIFQSCFRICILSKDFVPTDLPMTFQDASILWSTDNHV